MKEKMRKWSKGFITVMLTAVVMLCVSISAKAEDITTIQTNTTVEGCLESADDVFYYGFEMDKTGYMNISFEPQIGIGDAEKIQDGWTITLLSENNNTIYTTIYFTNTGEMELPTFDFKKGTKLYLKIKARYKPYAPIGLQYNITVHTTEADDWEQESNDTSKTANAIEFGKTYNGNLYQTNDVDFYSIKTTSNGFVSIALDPINQNSPEDNLGYGYTVSVYKSNKKVYTVTRITKATNNKIYLKKGTYFIMVEASFKNGSSTPLYNTYKIKTSFTAFAKPAKAAIKTLKATTGISSKAIKIKLKKVKNATGYQVQYSTKKTFKGKKSELLTTTSGTISGLGLISAPKKTYYIRARAYIETAGGQKVYGTWSKTKSVKTK